MSLTDYHKSILRLRLLPLKRTREIEERLDTALRMAQAQLDEIIAQSGPSGTLKRRLFEARRGNITALINELAVSLKRDMSTAMQEVAQEVAEVRQDETNRLLQSRGLPIVADFSQVPRQTLDLLAQRVDVEGLKVSAQIWARNQIKAIENEVLSAIARGTSAFSLSQRLRGYLLGSDALTSQELADLRTVKGVERRKLGHSISYKAKRLARTEINNAYWESGRLSAQESPVVLGISWNLSNRHPKWDVCDILAKQDVYGLSAGVYPPEALPVKPHPNDLCYQLDRLRPVGDWDKPKISPTLKMKDDDIFNLRGEGSRGYNEQQKKLAIELIKASHEASKGIISRSVGTTPESLTWHGQAKALIQKGITSETEARAVGKLIREALVKRLDETGAKAVDPFANPARLIEDEEAIRQTRRIAKKVSTALLAPIDERLDEAAKAIFRYSNLIGSLPKDIRTVPLSLYRIIQEALGSTTTIGAFTEGEAKNLIRRIEKHREFLQENLDFLKQSAKKVQADIVKEVLSEIREMGNNNEKHQFGGSLYGKKVDGGPKSLQDLIGATTDKMPTSWVKNSIQFGPLRIDEIRRGHYLHREPAQVSELRISGSGEDALSTAYHEMGHRFEHTVGRTPSQPQTIIGKLEEEFYKRRTSGEPIELMGAGYSVNEKTRPDKFTHRYIGKEYNKPNSYEILSMGLEGIYMNRYDILGKDTDMADFILGILGGL